ncbi:MAG: alpha/beta hydrolase-fold protein [Pseudomonadota bacterium]
MVVVRRNFSTSTMVLGWAVIAFHALELDAGESPGDSGKHVILGVQMSQAAACPNAPPQQVGACILSVRPGSAADRAGLHAGDLIVAIGDRPLADAAAVPAAVQSMSVGQSLQIRYLRSGTTGQVTVAFGPGDLATAMPIAAAIQGTKPLVAWFQTSHTDPCEDTLKPAGDTIVALPPYRKQPLAMDRPALDAMLGDKPAVIRLQGDVLTLAFRGSGNSARVTSGSIQCELDRVGDSDIWALQLRMAQWQQSFLSAHFLATDLRSSDPLAFGLKPTAEAQAEFRGTAAPSAPKVIQRLRGKMTHIAVPSRFLDAPKDVSIYLPPDRGSAPLPVLYMADGQNLPTVAALVEKLIDAHRIRPIAIVAEHAGRYTGDSSKPYDARLDDRMREYLPDADSAYFARHMRFFFEELLPWAEKQYKLSAARADRAAMGYSNGGAFVEQLGLLHPESFATVLPFSPAYGVSFGRELPGDATRLPRFLISGGELEPSFLRTARADAQWLKARGVPSELHTYWSGHDMLQWKQALADYLPEVFPPRRN